MCKGSSLRFIGPDKGGIARIARVAAATLAVLSQLAVTSAWAERETEAFLVQEDFSDGMARWWVEGGERTWVHEGRLHMKADPRHGRHGSVATAWLREELPADLRVSFDAQVISSRRGVNNINVFLSYSDPEGTSLFETREQRESAAYGLYHGLNGYIFTFLADISDEALEMPEDQRPARIRIRRCPGFELIAETYAYHNKAGHTYKVEIVKKGGELVFSVDGSELLRAQDDNAHGAGLLGLRTFGTYLSWDNIRVSSPGSQPE